MSNQEELIKEPKDHEFTEAAWKRCVALQKKIIRNRKKGARTTEEMGRLQRIAIVEWDRFGITGDHWFLSDFEFISVVIYLRKGISKTHEGWHFFCAVNHKKTPQWDIYTRKTYVGSIFKNWKGKYQNATYIRRGEFQSLRIAALDLFMLYLGISRGILAKVG